MSGDAGTPGFRFAAPRAISVVLRTGSAVLHTGKPGLAFSVAKLFSWWFNSKLLTHILCYLWVWGSQGPQSLLSLLSPNQNTLSLCFKKSKPQKVLSAIKKQSQFSSNSPQKPLIFSWSHCKQPLISHSFIVKNPCPQPEFLDLKLSMTVYISL